MKKIFLDQVALVVVLYALSIVPLMVAGYRLSLKINIGIDTLRRERLGIEYIHLLRKLLDDLPQHRGMTNAYLSGDTAFKEKCIAKQAQIESTIKAVDRLDQMQGRILKITEEWSRLKRRWQELKEMVFALRPEEAFALHTALIYETNFLVSNIGDVSNLNRDQNIDAYYLVRYLVDNLTWMVEYLGQLRGLGAGVAASQIISADKRSELLILLGRVKMIMEEDIRSIGIIFQANPKIKAQLETSVRENTRATQEFLELAMNGIINAESISILPQYYFTKGTGAITGHFTIFDFISSTLDGLLQDRIVKLSHERYWIWTLILIVGSILTCFYVTLIHNMTQRRLAEQALRESYNMTQSLLKTIPLAIDIVDEEGNLLFLNQNLEALVGKEAIGKKCWLLYKDDRQQCRDCPLKKSIQMGKTISVEATGILGGKTFQITHTGMVYRGKKAILEIFQDITQQKRVEEELRNSRDVLQKKVSELERFYRLSTDRELKMVELKKTIAQLEQELKIEREKR